MYAKHFIHYSSESGKSHTGITGKRFVHSFEKKKFILNYCLNKKHYAVIYPEKKHFRSSISNYFYWCFCFNVVTGFVIFFF